MAKHRESDPLWVERMERIKAVTGATTQVKLAEALDIRQSSISDAKRRQSIPKAWLTKLLASHDVLPSWIMTGQGPKLVGEAAPAAVARVEERLKAVEAELSQLMLDLAEDRRLARMTAEDFLAAKSGAEGRLSKGIRSAAAMQQTVTALAGKLADARTQ